MEMACYVGIDVAEDRLDVHIRPLAKIVAVANDEEGMEQLLEILSPLHIERVVLEASGGYEKAAFLALVEAGHAVSIVNPRQVRDFAKGAGRIAKTDTIDAATLAHFAEVFRPRETQPPTKIERQTAEYLVYRRYLIREMICARNQLRRLESPSLRAILEKRLASAKAECKVIEAEMAALVRASDKRELFDLLTSVPGVGALLACTLIANLRELGALSRQEIASLVGVAPMNNDSGRRRGHRFVCGGRGAIRVVLYMATLTASRFNGAIRTFYNRLRDAGKPSKVALTACMRKLLTILNAMVREGQRWRFS
jgi:transposase